MSSIPTGSVDVVIASLVIHLIASPSRALGEVFRILKPGGAFAFSCGGTSADPYCFVTASSDCVRAAGGQIEKAMEWIRNTKSKGWVTPPFFCMQWCARRLAWRWVEVLGQTSARLLRKGLSYGVEDQSRETD